MLALGKVRTDSELAGERTLAFMVFPFYGLTFKYLTMAAAKAAQDFL